MPEHLLVVRIPDKRLKYEYQRSCQLLGTSMSSRVHQMMHATINKAKDKFPQAFNMCTEEEELVIEAIECDYATMLDIRMYTRMERARVIQILRQLVNRGILAEIRKRRPNKGREPVRYKRIRI